MINACLNPVVAGQFPWGLPEPVDHRLVHRRLRDQRPRDHLVAVPGRRVADDAAGRGPQERRPQHQGPAADGLLPAADLDPVRRRPAGRPVHLLDHGDDHPDHPAVPDPRLGQHVPAVRVVPGVRAQSHAAVPGEDARDPARQTRSDPARRSVRNPWTGTSRPNRRSGPTERGAGDEGDDADHERIPGVHRQVRRGGHQVGVRRVQRRPRRPRLRDPDARLARRAGDGRRARPDRRRARAAPSVAPPPSARPPSPRRCRPRRPARIGPYEDRGPRRDYGDRGPRRDYGDRPPRRDDRPAAAAAEGDQAPRPEGGDRPPRRDDRPPRRDDRGPRRDDRAPRRDDRPANAAGPTAPSCRRPRSRR